MSIEGSPLQAVATVFVIIASDADFAKQNQGEKLVIELLVELKTTDFSLIIKF